ncbi:hypothetical protein C475_21197 [Halosimplex carlsbadense 2-9-1]|uniref:DUF2795 domain-containing protein n=1 Tax=Halosimplex carlsbadense 2-9-1 TaxID=797114 RepID=M0CAL0_9EURY|nr:hypothetical protein [Halosimplex carlsbadense]ELZ20331.1 hypothetical protein C475_21197 [Halosimplex carlsbadense 2-9-1]
MSESDDDHEQGVEFGSIESVFEGLSYPVTASELVEQFGDREIERTSADPIAIEDLFAGAGDQSFESDEELRQGMLNMMPAESVGRQRYSDRGGSDRDDLAEEDETSG